MLGAYANPIRNLTNIRHLPTLSRPMRVRRPLKLQRYKSREVEGKAYYKYVLNPSPKMIEELGWGPDEDLDAEVRNGKLVISRKEE